MEGGLINGKETAGRCQAERYDFSLKKTYKSIEYRDDCFNFVGCLPPESCLGNNTCETGYQYQMNKCMLWETAGVRNNPNSGKGLGKYVCESDVDCRTRSGKKNRPRGMPCDLRSPEDCSRCVKVPNENGTLIGHCECTEPIKCSLCTFQEYFFMDGKCEPCPDNPALILIAFVLAIIMAVAGSYVLNSYNFNMAFISIGFDYFQVLALGFFDI